MPKKIFMYSRLIENNMRISRGVLNASVWTNRLHVYVIFFNPKIDTSGVQTGKHASSTIFFKILKILLLANADVVRQR